MNCRIEVEREETCDKIDNEISTRKEKSLMFRFLSTAFLFCVIVGSDPAMAQAPPANAAVRPPRTPPPARDPNTPGYVKAKALPDGANAPANKDGNFIIGQHTNRRRR